ncbi:MAG: single-stranded DNA-binding protein [Bacillota bacterium]
MLNRIILIGRLVKEPELRYTPNGVPVATFRLAVDRTFTNTQTGQRETDFIDIVTWRKLAENCAQHLGKGRLVGVEGRLQIRSYETQDGQKRQKAEVVADNVQFLDRPKESSGSSGPGPAAAGAGDDVKVSEDDIPF